MKCNGLSCTDPGTFVWGGVGVTGSTGRKKAQTMFIHAAYDLMFRLVPRDPANVNA